MARSKTALAGRRMAYSTPRRSPGARVGAVPVDQCAQPQAFVQLAREQDTGIGGHRRAPELDAKLRIKREANRARCCVTHWVVPSASARSPREPRVMRA